jgi:hypothetical protein
LNILDSEFGNLGDLTRYEVLTYLLDLGASKEDAEAVINETEAWS